MPRSSPFAGHRPRSPEDSVLYQAVTEHLPLFRDLAGATGSLPAFVERELEAFLRLVVDEASVQVPGVACASGDKAGGVGLLTILALGPDQQARQGSVTSRPLILRGTQFRARLQVVVPASGASGLDPVSIYSGTGRFLTTNTTWRAG